MRVLVCGDRNWSNEDIMSQVLDAVLGPNDVVIEGAARGADTMALKIAQRMGKEVLEFPAQWGAYGRAAGPIRNQQMLDEGEPTLVLAFHDHILLSKGTKDMIAKARLRGIPVRLYTTTEPGRTL